MKHYLNYQLVVGLGMLVCLGIVLSKSKKCGRFGKCGRYGRFGKGAGRSGKCLGNVRVGLESVVGLGNAGGMVGLGRVVGLGKCVGRSGKCVGRSMNYQTCPISNLLRTRLVIHSVLRRSCDRSY
jgi:hypothetical protein